MLGDRDITIRAVARGMAPDTCKVREAMSADIKRPIKLERPNRVVQTR